MNPLSLLSEGYPRAEWDARALAGLRHLAEARAAALAVGTEPWEFAVSLPDLYAAGVGCTEVRWLIARGLVDHAAERFGPGPRRRFRRVAALALSLRSCFVVTPEGQRLLDLSATAAGPARADGPRWDRGRRQLWLHDQLVKWFRVPAASQETILAAFQEDGWPSRIDDPLMRRVECTPQDRLHEAVKGLNRHQVRPLLRFFRDGTGLGVAWAERAAR
jgi:hypothetical protein